MSDPVTLHPWEPLALKTAKAILARGEGLPQNTAAVMVEMASRLQTLAESNGCDPSGTDRAGRLAQWLIDNYDEFGSKPSDKHITEAVAEILAITDETTERR